MNHRKPEAKPTAATTPATPLDWSALASEIHAAAALAAALHAHHARDDDEDARDSAQVRSPHDSDMPCACSAAVDARRESTSVLYACLLKGVRDARLERQRVTGDAA